MKKILAALAVIALMFVGMVTISSPATAAEDTRPCVTSPEMDRIPKTNKGQIEAWFDVVGIGWNVYHDPYTFLIRHYPYCGGNGGWAAVSYYYSKTGGWLYHKALIVTECAHQDGDGPWVPCDPSDYHFTDNILFRHAAKQSVPAGERYRLAS